MTDQDQRSHDDGLLRRTVRALFAFRGRIGRLAFMAGAPLIVFAALMLLYVSIATAGNDRSTLVSAISGVLFVLAVLGLWPLAAQLAKRLHDLNRSGWHGLWLMALWLAPGVLEGLSSTIATLAALAAALFLVTTPGSSGRNAYGEPT